MLLAVIAAAWAGLEKLRDPRTLPVQQVRIEGEFAHLDRAELERVAAPLVAGGFFTIDLREVETAVEALPWVFDASLRREWPGTLVLAVSEQVAIAHWGEDALLNPYGELFTPPPASFPAGLPELHGPAGQQRALIERFIEVSKLLKTAGLQPRALIEDERRAWRLTLDNGVEILLGREESLARLERFVAVYPQTLERRADALQRVDLRYTNGFAVAWRAETQPAAQ